MKRLTLIVSLFFVAFLTHAQIIEPITWSFSSTRDGRDVELEFKASIDMGWHLYDTRLPEGGPIATQVVYNDSSRFEFQGELKKTPQPVQKFDSTFQMDLRYFSDEATLKQSIRLKSDEPVDISGYVLFMGCDDETCLPPNEAAFSFQFNGADGAGAGEVASGSGTEIAAGSSSGSSSGSAGGQ